MTCAACSTRVEKAVSKLEGVDNCTVNLLTNSMNVEGEASAEVIINAVESAGYGAALKTGSKGKSDNQSEYEEMLIDKETPVLKQRLIYSLGFLAILMYISMGHMMWGFPLPQILENNHIAMGILQMLLAIIVMVINQKFFINGFKSLFHRAPNMDTLVALGSASAFVYSTYALFAMTDAQLKGDSAAVMAYMHEFYFESAAMILTLITVGKMLEARSKGKTTDAIKSLMKISPKTATILRNDIETEVAIDEVSKGDIFIVKPGESIPADGIIIEGTSTVNESALTGESIPVDKATGDKVSAATINQTGFIKCEALRVGEDTALSQIIKMVSDASATKAPIAKVADKVSGVFVPVVIIISVITILIWLTAGQTIGYALARGISVLVISCPCALGLATPVAIMVGNGVGAKNGIMFKTAVALEQTGKTQIAVLDKTGTITSGEPEVTDIFTVNDIDENYLLQLANSLEIKSEHPLAKAVTEYASDNKIEALEISEFEALPGNGLKAVCNNKMLYGGNAEFISTKVNIPDKMLKVSQRLSDEGKTPLFFAQENKLVGIIAVADVIKADNAEAIKELQNMGIFVAMLTGDNERTAQAIGKQAGVDKVIAGVLPDGKEKVIRSFKEKGKVLMVGDGINDAPALTSADIGIAIGAGTDIAIDAADIVLMKNTLKDVAAAIRLSRYTLKNIHQNLFWAFFYNIIGIPLAAGLWIPVFGWKLNPMFGAAAMSLSSFFVVTNALRLNFKDIYDTSKDKTGKMSLRQELFQQTDINNDNLMINNTKMEDDFMTKTMKIEGMMCGHCEARVKKCLEALEQVTEAKVSHEEGTAILTLSQEISNEELTRIIEEQDYKVLSVE